MFDSFFFRETRFANIEDNASFNLLNKLSLVSVHLLLGLRILHKKLHVRGPHLLWDLKLSEAVFAHANRLVSQRSEILAHALFISFNLVVFEQIPSLIGMFRVGEESNITAIASKRGLYFKKNLKWNQATAVQRNFFREICEVFFANLFFGNGQCQLVLQLLITLVELQPEWVFESFDVFVLS